MSCVACRKTVPAPVSGSCSSMTRMAARSNSISTRTRRHRPATPRPDLSQSPAAALIAAAGVEQELAVAGRAGDRAFDDPDHPPAGLRPQPSDDAGADRLLNGRGPHDPALTNLFRPGLELRLD